MLASLLLAAVLPPVIADPRLGPSSWVVTDLINPPPPAEGYLVRLPERVDEGWLARLVQLASGTAPVVALGLPEKESLTLYFDGVVVAQAEQVRELRRCCPGVAAVVTATQPAEAVERLAWGAASLMVAGRPAWAEELRQVLPESQPASWNGGALPTASREEDLALLVGVPPGFAGGPVVLPSTWVAPWAQLLAQGASQELPVTLQGEQAYVRVPPLAGGGLVLVPRPLPPGGWEKVEVRKLRELSVEEVLARHHRQLARQQRLLRSYQGQQRLLLRLRVEQLSRSFELVMVGPVYFDARRGSDWQVRQAWVDGVAWDPKELPELPLLQPQAPPVPPLALELSPSYRYRLEGSEARDGRLFYLVRYEQQAQGHRLWGRAWVDGETFGLAQLELVQESPQGAVRTSRSRTRNYLVWLGGAPLWLPAQVEADDLLAVFGGVVALHRQLTLEGLVVNPPDEAQQVHEAWASREIMFRERAGEVVRLESDGRGGRREAKGERGRQRFLLAGAAWDPSLSFPLPLAGYQLLDFRFRGQDQQLRAFLAGAVNDVAWSRPGRRELSANAFVQAAPFTSRFWHRREEDRRQEVRTLRQHLGASTAVHWGALRLSLGAEVAHLAFGRTRHTDPAFLLPRSGPELLVKAGLAWQKGQWLAQLRAEQGFRPAWSRWGYGEPGRRAFLRAHGLAQWESNPLPLVRAGVGIEVAGSSHTDRFSRFALGSVLAGLAGMPADRVGAEAYAALRFSLAFPLSLQRRVELGWEGAWLRHRRDGYHARPVSGVRLGLSTRGPWRSVLQVQVSMPLVLPGLNRPKASLLLLRPLGP